MPTSPLIARALVATIALQLSIAGTVVSADGPGAASTASSLERAEVLTTVGLVGRDVVAAAEAGDPIEVGAPAPEAPPTTAVPMPEPAPVTVPPTSSPPPTAAPAPATAAAAPTAAAPDPAAPSPAPAPAPQPAPEPAPSSRTTAAGSWRDGACEASMLQWMNEARTASGRAGAADDPVVDHVAFDWSDHLAAAGQLAHNPRYADQVFAARPEAMTVGEVVGRGTDPRPVFDEFLRSPTHRDVILGSSYTRATVGCVRDAGGQVWVVANFWG